MDIRAWQIEHALEQAIACQGLACESLLRVAAATLSNSPSRDITSTTVVGVLGRDDLPAFRELVRDISEQYAFDARVKVNVGTFSVRFTDTFS